MKRRSPHCRARGFSLVEVLVATALMSFIFAALATVTSQWLPNWARGFVRVQQSEIVALGLDRLVADLSAAQMVPARRATPPFLFVFDGSESAVTFVRTALGPNAGSGLELVRITTSSGGGGPTLLRTRALFVPGGAQEATPPNFTDPVVLLRGPYQISFSYAGEDRIWQKSWREAARLPRAIRVTVRDLASGRTLPVSTIAGIHAEVPAGCVLLKVGAPCFPPSANAGGTPAREL